MAKKYRYILFDLDRTLWDFTSNSRRALKKTIDEMAPELDSGAFINEYEKANDHYWNLYENGTISKERLRILRFHTPLNLFGNYSEETASAMSERYLKLMTEENGLVEGCTQLLQYLKGIGCKMSVVTNGFREVQYLKLKNSGIDGYFDSVIISDEAGCMKPNPAIFRYAVESLGGTKPESIMIGDNFATDIEGAQIYGIDQAYYNPGKTPCEGGPTYEIHSLEELKEIIV